LSQGAPKIALLRNVERRFNWIRKDPEFGALLQAMKFP
jgi:hypothetical protein